MKRSAPESIQSSGLKMKSWSFLPPTICISRLILAQREEKVKITHDRIANVTSVIVKQKMEMEHPM